MSIKTLISSLMADNIKTQVVVGKVLAVDTGEMACDVDLQGSPDMFEVRLRAVIDSDPTGLLIVPTVGSYVLVGLINNRPESAFVCGFTSLDSVKIITDEIELSGNNLGGLVKINDLVNKLNLIENSVNQLKTEFNAHTHTAPSGATGVPLIPSTVSLTNTAVSDLENENVKHGN